MRSTFVVPLVVLLFGSYCQTRVSQDATEVSCRPQADYRRRRQDTNPEPLALEYGIYHCANEQHGRKPNYYPDCEEGSHTDHRCIRREFQIPVPCRS